VKTSKNSNVKRWGRNWSPRIEGAHRAQKWNYQVSEKRGGGWKGGKGKPLMIAKRARPHHALERKLPCDLTEKETEKGSE